MVLDDQDFICNKLPSLTYMQISDAMHEFLCLGDQIKLIKVDRSRLDWLRQNKFTVEEMINYVNGITSKCLDLNQGCGRFFVGKPLDEVMIK